LYLLVIHVPIYRDGSDSLLPTDWKRSLELLRDSLGGRFGPLAVVAPSLPRSDRSQQMLEPCSQKADGIKLIPSIDARCTAPQLWLRDRRRWVADVHDAARNSQIAHCHMDDPVKPIAGLGMLTCVRAGLPTIFVEDTDIALQMRELSRGMPVPTRINRQTRALMHEQTIRWCVKNADMSLLKGRTLMERYARYTTHAHCFHDTSHRSSEVVSEAVLDARLARLATTESVRLVYCGRLMARKGVQSSVELVQRVNAMAGRRVCELDIIGSGPEVASIEGMIERDGAKPAVRMLGSFPYGPSLLSRLSTYDGLLFTPTAEDTPRMIFDGYAAGLPLFGFDIEYVKERSDEERATVLLDRHDPEAAARALLEACLDRPRLFTLTRAAREAGEFHASDRWYQRRAQWTFELVARVEREGTCRSQAVAQS